jgi:Fe-S cluster assembly protein SufD
MSTAAETLAETLLDRVDELPRQGPAWLTELREQAAGSLREHGFPHKKLEAWRFSPVDSIVRVPFHRAPDEPAPAWEKLAARDLEGDASFRVLSINGRVRLDGEPPEGVQIDDLAGALKGDPEGDGLRRHLGQAVPTEHFAALNTALFDDVVVVRVQTGAASETPVHLVHVTAPGSDPTAAYPRVLVVAEAGSELRLIETYVGASEGPKQLTSAVTEVFVGDGAVVDHLRVVRGEATGHHLASLSVRQARSSSYASRSVVLGGALSRLDIDVVMQGEFASCVLDGIYHTSGAAHVDHHTFIDHAVPRCSSQETYRGILDGRSHAVFDGTIAVRKDAQQSSAHQENRNLLLSDDATIHTKPHLQIDADDVSCSHGATIGALDADSLFYLRARGIGEEQAQAMLTYAFVKALVDRIPDEPSRRRIGRALLERLPHGEHESESDYLEELA